jgi:hypothetical protein
MEMETVFPLLAAQRNRRTSALPGHERQQRVENAVERPLLATLPYGCSWPKSDCAAPSRKRPLDGAIDPLLPSVRHKTGRSRTSLIGQTWPLHFERIVLPVMIRHLRFSGLADRRFGFQNLAPRH